jgi:hypothetical protein
MWFSPRATIRRILDSDVRPGWVVVIALAAASAAVSSLQLDETGALSPSRSAMPVVMSGLQMIFGVLIGPFLMAIVGGWLGGEADPSDLRHAVAWSYVPVAATSLLWIPIFLTIGTRAFATDGGPLVGVEWLSLPLLVAISLSYVWTIPLLVGGLAAAQRFSIARAIAYVVVLSVPLFMLTALG